MPGRNPKLVEAIEADNSKIHLTKAEIEAKIKAEKSNKNATASACPIQCVILHSSKSSVTRPWPQPDFLGANGLDGGYETHVACRGSIPT